MKETLSQSQVSNICDESNATVRECVTDMESKISDFAYRVSKVWEDNNAVECMKNLKSNMNDVIVNLDANNASFIRMIESIANYYNNIGGMPKVSVTPVHVIPSINVDVVKPYFADGNGDDFGFSNPNAGTSQVMDAFENLDKNLRNASENAKNKINAIPAFGNSAIQTEIARSAKKVISIVEEAIDKMKSDVETLLQQTAESYIHVGTMAEDTIHGISEDVPPPTVPYETPTRPATGDEAGPPIVERPPRPLPPQPMPPHHPGEQYPGGVQPPVQMHPHHPGEQYPGGVQPPVQMHPHHSGEQYPGGVQPPVQMHPHHPGEQYPGGVQPPIQVYPHNPGGNSPSGPYSGGGHTSGNTDGYYGGEGHSGGSSGESSTGSSPSTGTVTLPSPPAPAIPTFGGSSSGDGGK